MTSLSVLLLNKLAGLRQYLQDQIDIFLQIINYNYKLLLRYDKLFSTYEVCKYI